MIIYPAIDLLDGKCVRLYRGDYGRVTEYSDDPLRVARAIGEAGADWIHVVDLNAAKTGRSENRGIIHRIAAETGLRVQTGGGIRTMPDIETLLAAGVSRCVIGTAAVRDPDFARAALSAHADRIAVGVDSRDGWVRVSGWTEDSGLDTLSFVRQIRAWGGRTVIYTDIDRDGALTGPALAASRELMAVSGLEVIISGGISCEADVAACSRIGAAGVIIGKALYEGKVDLRSCLRNASSPA